MPVVQIGGQALYTFEHRVAGLRVPPLLLIHGAGGQHAHWPPPVRRLPGVPVYAPDLPGHGRSEGPGCASIADYAAVLLALMDALGVGQFIPVGHSMGGAVALRLALDEPGRVAGLGLVSSGARLRVAPQILDNVLDDYGAVVELVVEWQYGPGAGEKIRRLARRQLKALPPAVTQGDYLACDAFDVRDRLAEIAAPALVVCGTADQMTPLKYAEYLADNLPDASLARVEGAGHMLPAECPDELVRILRGWLAARFAL